MSGAGTVLVTGASGFVGTHLVAALTRRGFTVLGTSRTGGSGTEAIDLSIGTPPLLELLRRSEVDVVLHLAAAGVTGDRDELASLVASNVLGTTHLLEAVTEARVRRFVHVSTDLADDSTDPYGCTKYLAEVLVSHAAAVHRLDAINLRLPVIFGRNEPPTKLVPMLLQSAARGVEPELRTPNRVRGFLHIDDAVDAIVHSIGHGSPGATLRPPSAGRCSLAALAALARDAVQDAQTIAEPELHMPSNPLPGWRPRAGLREALRRASQESAVHRQVDA